MYRVCLIAYNTAQAEIINLIDSPLCYLNAHVQMQKLYHNIEMTTTQSQHDAKTKNGTIFLILKNCIDNQLKSRQLKSCPIFSRCISWETI